MIFRCDNNPRPRLAHAVFPLVNTAIKGFQVIPTPTPCILPTFLAFHSITHDDFFSFDPKIYFFCKFWGTFHFSYPFRFYRVPFTSISSINFVPLTKIWLWKYRFVNNIIFYCVCFYSSENPRNELMKNAIYTLQCTLPSQERDPHFFGWD